MEQQLRQVMNKAHDEQVVATLDLDNGTQLIAYPLQRGMLVGLGYPGERGHHVRPEALLQKRSAYLARFGVWLPAAFADGSCYVVRRIGYFNRASSLPALSDEDLNTARELLS